MEIEQKEYQEIKNPYPWDTDGIRHLAWQEGFKAQEPNLIETADFFHKAKEGYDKQVKDLMEDNKRLTKTIDGQRTTLSEQWSKIVKLEAEVKALRGMLIQISAWLSFNTNPSAEELAKMKNSIDQLLKNEG